MNEQDILQEIAYLDPGLDKQSAGAFSPAEMIALVHDAIQVEMAKQGHLRKAEDVSERLASIETRMESMRREFIRQRGIPSVIYVSRGELVANTGGLHGLESKSAPPVEAKLPKAMVAFYSLGLICSLTFATLLSLSAMKVETLHPFISLLGLIGGLGWLTTAWTDLLLWKREKPSAEFTQEDRTLPASHAR